MWEPLLQLSGPTQRAGADHATQAQSLESRKHERHEQRFWRYLYAGRVSRDFPTFFGWSTTASWGVSLLKKVGKSGEEWGPGWGNITVCVHSLQHGSDGEPWRKTGGKVFEGVDHQVYPGGTDRKQSHRSSVLLLDNIWSLDIKDILQRRSLQLQN